MLKRRFWLNRIEEAWSERPILWLPGVRRVGKTTLSLSIPGVSYFDCELPRVRRIIEEDSEKFWGQDLKLLTQKHSYVYMNP